MSEEILVNVNPRETRVALLDNGMLQELFIERASKRGLVGNIYKGKVVRVLPGMQAAFIDAGLERTAFLHAADIAKFAYTEGDAEEKQIPDIRELLRENEELLVQVLKDPIGSKGARLTTHVSFPSRYLVYMPSGEMVALSTRIEDPEERERLISLVQEQVTASGNVGGGYIVRTVGEGVTAEALRADMLYLNRLWDSIRDQAADAKAGDLVHADLPLPVRIIRDLLHSEVENVRVDSEESFNQMQLFTQQFIPEMSSRIEVYTGKRPIFDLYNVEDEIQRALERKVMLKSGGYLIIDQTEAMTTIDVNTGAYVGHRSLDETVLKTNLEATQAIARQLRLRNLGGIIIIDFIDMLNAEHRERLQRALAAELEGDYARTQVCPVSSLGLVEMTRKRSRESLEHILCEPCQTCGGRSSIRTAETVCYEIFREIVREANQFNLKEILVLAAQEVIDMLLDEESASLAELEATIGQPIRLQVESLYTPEQFDVVPV